ncbi:MAG: hypothetical protein HY909_30185 [Deltaproteobacteria bacterium]|nr:hypothetical protein [Deltaproteobacteria bacterium]
MVLAGRERRLLPGSAEHTMAFASHEEYFARLSPDPRRLLQSIQARVEALVPGASRCIRYNMPAFKHGRVFLYFAAFKNHIGIYPPVTQDAPLAQELAPYRNEKGNLSFPHSQPLPIELIGRVALALSRECKRK